jgi:formate dehydrogenase major subunit
MAAMMRKDGVYLLPACTQFETGFGTASNRSLQWREKVIEPLFESKPDHTIMYAFAKKFGFEKEFCKNIKLEKDKQGWDEPNVEDILREINRGCWTIGYTGQSPERLKLHMKNMHTFDVKTLKRQRRPLRRRLFRSALAVLRHAGNEAPGTPNLYDTSKHVMDGGGNFRANFGVEKDGVSLLAEDGSASKGADLQMGYPNSTMCC